MSSGPACIARSPQRSAERGAVPAICCAPRTSVLHAGKSQSKQAIARMVWNPGAGERGCVRAADNTHVRSTRAQPPMWDCSMQRRGEGVNHPEHHRVGAILHWTRRTPWRSRARARSSGPGRCWRIGRVARRGKSGSRVVHATVDLASPAMASLRQRRREPA